MQFKVPQNVQMADKIVGPLTFKQLIIVACGGAISYFIYMSTSNMYVLTVWGPATAIPAILTLAIAFLRINDIPFLKFVLLQLQRALTPQRRMFQRGSAEVFRSILAPTSSQTAQNQKTIKKLARKEETIQQQAQNLDNITKILDSQAEITK